MLMNNSGRIMIMKINNDQREILKSINVLFVEDDDEIQQQISFFLKRKVGRLYTASNGREGLELYAEYKPGVVITDIRMPVMDGLEMTKRIRETDQDIPIIITTAYNEQAHFLKSTKIKIAEFVIKPINPYLLLDAIVKSVNNHSMHKTSGEYATVQTLP